MYFWDRVSWLVLYPEDDNRKGSDFPKAIKNYKSTGKIDLIEYLQFLN